ncbi:MAG: phosphate signaling complex protein PhoU [Hespellia sp.]|nr:phosphate signaling complex protein PhoU [Hespellia sp.]
MTRNRFDAQLRQMNDELLAMGDLCVRAITNVTEALEAGDAKRAKIVISEDEQIDQKEKEIESICLKLLLQQQPVARDLRQISAALKMITDMERIGDQTADIAEIIMTAGIVGATDIETIGLMSEKASQMVKESVEAFVNKDLELTRKVIQSDDIVDDLFDEVKENLVSYIAKEGKQGAKAIDMMMIAKYLERIGDHATNIAEWVEFSITGVHHSEDQ